MAREQINQEIKVLLDQLTDTQAEWVLTFLRSLTR